MASPASPRHPLAAPALRPRRRREPGRSLVATRRRRRPPGEPGRLARPCLSSCATTPAPFRLAPRPRELVCRRPWRPPCWPTTSSPRPCLSLSSSLHLHLSALSWSPSLYALRRSTPLALSAALARSGRIPPVGHRPRPPVPSPRRSSVSFEQRSSNRSPASLPRSIQPLAPLHVQAPAALLCFARVDPAPFCSVHAR
ncbi:hypothetical protein ACQJBY_016766 [Aegilops geniculata]